ncbi:MAG TPA: Flp pilus assembly protein CpaB [Rhizomicrobium sp.]|nr:Flp pilus assembly protein CpaB [Rhizomicrobium sp.]
MVIAAMVLSVGLVAVLAGPWSRATSRLASVPLQPKMIAVLAATHALPVGSEIGQDDVTTKFVPGSEAVGAVSSRTDVFGRITAKQYAAKEVFARDSLRDPSTLGIAARVHPGQRAFSIRIAEDDIVGGFLQSGDHVDVFATIPGSVFPSKDAGDKPDRSQTVLLLQNISVLAVGENPATKGAVQSSARTVSLELSPDGLARLALAERFGKVSLAIRKPGDETVAQPVSAALSDLVPVAVAESAPTPAHAFAPLRHRHGFGIPFFVGTRSGYLSVGGSQ